MEKKEKADNKPFWKNLYFDNTLDILAKKSQAPVIGAFLKRNGKNNYTLICEEISLDDPGKETAKKALYLWQKYVKMNPEQWYQWKKWNQMKAG